MLVEKLITLALVGASLGLVGCASNGGSGGGKHFDKKPISDRPKQG